jgi:hypothetical protein
MGSRQTRFTFAEFLFLALVVGIVLLVYRAVARPTTLEFTVFLLAGIVVLVCHVGRRLVQNPKQAVVCRDCGQQFLPRTAICSPPVCPRCQQRSLTPDQWRVAHSKNLRMGWIAIFWIVVALAVVLWLLLDQPNGAFDWVHFSILVLATIFAVLVAIVFMAVVATVTRTRLMRGDEYALAHARKVAGESGREELRGPVSLWSFGCEPILDGLMICKESVQRRFETLTGDGLETRGTLRIFVFAKRQALVNFHRQASTDLWHADGVYLGDGPVHTITLTTEVVPYHLTEFDRLTKSVFGFYVVQLYKGFVLDPWLRHGIASTLASNSADLARVNRKMLVALERQSVLGPELFRLRHRGLMRLLSGWRDQATFAKHTQFMQQSWSFVDYMWGDEAQATLRDPFRVFLRSLEQRESAESALERDMRRSPEELLDGWKDWVRKRGVGTYGEPPAHVQAAILNRVVPIIEDPRAKVMDRIQAIREMGRLGYTVGADALIRLLADGSEIPTNELVWSLEAISGLVLGDDLKRWEAWWGGVETGVLGKQHFS